MDIRKQNLKVVSSTKDDNSIVAMSQSKMTEMGIRKLSLVTVEGYRQVSIACIAVADENVGDGNFIGLGVKMQNRLFVRIGEFIQVRRNSEKVFPCLKLHVRVVGSCDKRVDV